MREILTLCAISCAACGNGMIQLEALIPVEGPLTGDAFTDVALDSSTAGENLPLPTDFMPPSMEVDTSRGYCQTQSSRDGETSCVQERYGPHYALVTIANHNEDTSGATAGDDPIEVKGDLIGSAQLDRYTVAFSPLDNGPTIAPNGISGLLGMSIAPQRRKTFAVVLLGADGKAEFRASGETTPRRYAAKFTFEGPGGLVVEGGTTVMLGDFSNCGEDGTPVAFCSGF